jgi:poly(A) polymerase
MEHVLEKMHDEGIPIFLESYSALDRYFGVKEPGSVHLLTDSSLVSLAKIFESLQYPGTPLEDACLVEDDRRYVFRCVDKIEEMPPHPFTAQYLIYSHARDTFLDPKGIYRDLRLSNLVEAGRTRSVWLAVMEAAKLVSRYHYEIQLPLGGMEANGFEPSPYVQKEFLSLILSSRYSEKGLSLLYRAGFIERFWPELFEMAGAHHSKEYHPEGNVWEHTLQSLKYRKKRNPILSMAILLHDIGKPVAVKLKDKPFKDHAELGTRIASSFLRFLGYNPAFIRDVAFLIRYHMFPAAMKKLPLYRMEKLMDSRLFPLLLELYRADLSSTFRGPDCYYEACRIYKTYLKRRGNPYRVLRRDKKIL